MQMHLARFRCDEWQQLCDRVKVTRLVGLKQVQKRRLDARVLVFDDQIQKLLGFACGLIGTATRVFLDFNACVIQ